MPTLPYPTRRTLFLAATFAALLAAACTAPAQSQKGLDDDRPGAAKTHKQKERPPRAVAVFEWTSAIAVKGTPADAATPAAIGTQAPPTLSQARKGIDASSSAAGTGTPSLPTPTPSLPSDSGAQKPAAGRIVPVSVFYQGKYQDGGLYLAEPSPLALSSDALYAIENAGDPLGFFTVHDATRARGDWVGFGLWAAIPPGMTAVEMYPDKGADSDVLKGTRDPSLDDKADDDKPTLRHHQAAAPKGKKKEPKKPEDHVTVPNPGADPDRPKLSAKTEEVKDLPEILGYPPDLLQTAAVSDSSVMDERSFAHIYTAPSEAAAARTQMQQLALAHLAEIAPAPATAVRQVGIPQRSPRLRNAHVRTALPQVPLANVQFGAYDLAYEDEPTYVLTAQTTGTPSRYVTLIARPDVYGKLQPAWWSMTDPSQLSITPRYRLIDAVDADGDGRAEILMESRNNDGRRFVLFQLYRGVATQVFSTEIIP